MERNKESWIRPSEGSIKFNVDAGYDGDQGRGSLGVIARDYSGKYIAASCKEIPFVAHSFMAKAYAIKEGLSLAQYLGCNKIAIQSDNSQVIDTMKEGGFSATSSTAIFDDCKVLAIGFREIIFVHCNREANEVAHVLARHNYYIKP